MSHDDRPILSPDIPFSLTCQYCDAGSDVESYEDAVEEGWIGIEYVPELAQANYTGVCPSPECIRLAKEYP